MGRGEVSSSSLERVSLSRLGVSADSEQRSVERERRVCVTVSYDGQHVAQAGPGGRQEATANRSRAHALNMPVSHSDV